MAIVELQRAWYRPKLPVIHYVSQQRVLVRARPTKVRNPRTKAQQANRGKMAIASRFLAQLQDFVIHGFNPGKRPNGRPVGAYHVALGHLLSNAIRREGEGWKIEYKNVQLSEGQSLNEYSVRVNRQGRTLRLRWLEGLPEGALRIRLAFHSPTRGESLCFEVNAPKMGRAVEVLLPKWVESDALHMWWIPAVQGKTRWRSKYLFLPAGGKIVVGWMVGHTRMGDRNAIDGGARAPGFTGSQGVNPPCLAELAALGGG